MNARGVVRIRACSSPLKRDRDETSLPTGSSHAAQVSCPESQLRAGALPGPSRSAPKCRTLPGLRLLKDAGGREPDQGGDKAPFLSRRRILCLKKDDGQCAATGPVGVLSPQPVLHELGNYKDICHMLDYAYSKPDQGAQLYMFLLLVREETHMLPHHHHHPPHTHTCVHSLCKGQEA